MGSTSFCICHEHERIMLKTLRKTWDDNMINRQMTLQSLSLGDFSSLRFAKKMTKKKTGARVGGKKLQHQQRLTAFLFRRQ